MNQKSSYVVWEQPLVTRQDREALNGHRSFVLDGDNVRHGLSSNLDFSEEDRKENIRRIGEAAKLMTEAGIIALTAFISPFRADREMVRNLFPHGGFIEVYCNASLEVCESRDVKGLYKKARAGEIKNYTGINSPYEAPVNPELIIDTAFLDLNQASGEIMEYLKDRELLK